MKTCTRYPAIPLPSVRRLVRNRAATVLLPLLLSLVPAGRSLLADERANPSIGRPVRIVTLSFPERNDVQEIARLVAREASAGTDLIVLPETWTGTQPEPIDGPATTAMAEIARKYRTYIVSPIYRQVGSDCYNSAVLLDREGKVACIYDKIFPFPPEYLPQYHNISDLKCGHEAKVFQTDFGKVGFAICFDVNFPALWQQLEDRGAEMVVWPSAYPGPHSIQAHAALHHYYIVSATHNARQTNNCPVYDITGDAILGPNIPDKKTGEVTVARFTLDLDRTIFGTDYGYLEKAQQLVKSHPGKIAIEQILDHEGWFVMKAIAPGISVREMTRAVGVPTLHEFLVNDAQRLTDRRGSDFGAAPAASGIPLSAMAANR